jgi:hypothetical protein
MHKIKSKNIDIEKKSGIYGKDSRQFDATNSVFIFFQPLVVLSMIYLISR